MCDIFRIFKLNARMMDKIGKTKKFGEEYNGSYDYGRRSTAVCSERGLFENIIFSKDLINKQFSH